MPVDASIDEGFHPGLKNIKTNELSDYTLNGPRGEGSKRQAGSDKTEQQLLSLYLLKVIAYSNTDKQ